MIIDILSPAQPEIQGVPETSGGEPLDAVSDVADTTSEAALTFLNWITSGEREALLAVIITALVATAFYTARYGLLVIIPKLPGRDQFASSAILKRMVSRLRSYFILSTALLIANNYLSFSEAVQAGIQIVFVLAAVVQCAELVQELTVSVIKRGAVRNSGDAVALASAVNVLKWLASVAIWSVALLLILDNIGADVTALLAGLGIGGVAIGLAAQGIFRDLFSALSIIFDRPFQRGDTVRYEDTWGTIEDIGLKTTRIRSKSGEQIIISNTNLLDLEIHNMGRMRKRRIETSFGIIYGTHPDMAERVIGLVSALVKDIEGVELEHCNFSGFGNSSLDYELVFHSLNPDYKRSKAAASKVLLAVFRKFHEEGIEFAFPTQTIHLASVRRSVSEEIASVFEYSLNEAQMDGPT